MIPLLYQLFKHPCQGLVPPQEHRRVPEPFQQKGGIAAPGGVFRFPLEKAQVDLNNIVLGAVQKRHSPVGDAAIDKAHISGIQPALLPAAAQQDASRGHIIEFQLFMPMESTAGLLGIPVLFKKQHGELVLGQGDIFIREPFHKRLHLG